MPGTRRGRSRTPASMNGRRLARNTAAKLGQAIRDARERRRWSQRQLGARVGISRQRIGQIELGAGSALPTEVWFALGSALNLPLRLEFGRDALQEPTDAGHLKIQELMLRLARNLGVARFFELPTRPTDPALSADVGWRDERRRVLILNECWNTFGSINAAVRSTHRKIAEAGQLAAATVHDGHEPYRVAACWIVRDTRANRDLLARYPEVFENAFPGSSQAWVRALTDPTAPVPNEPGLVWADLNATRVFAWRRRPVMLSPQQG